MSNLLPPKARLLRGFWIAVVLWTLFMLGTAYMSASTLWQRVAADSVMKAAVGNAWGGRIAWEIGGFLVTLVLLHLAFAVVTWLLACAGSAVSTDLRPKFGRLVVGWFSVLAAAALAYNALWFPRTLIGAYYHDTMSIPVGPWKLGQVVYYLAFTLCAVVAARAAVVLYRNTTARVRRRALVVGAAAVVVAAIVALFPAARPSIASAATASRPNVILLGIDSLRLEQLRRYGGSGITPNLDRFLAKADLFTDVTTPVARTFPSWSAILSARAPTLTGARYNLAERSSVRVNPTIGDVLRKAGYRTVYATDEVRFANFDETYGFDQVVTPRIGASDFLVGTYNEMPLASFFINTRIGKWLFPYSYANRGVATMFQPESYMDRLQREISFDQPTFFIAHLTAAHWPYYTSGVPFGVSTPTPGNERPIYRIGLQTADRMFGELVGILQSKGALRNALVIVLSDHGEALRLPTDSFFDETFHVKGLRAPLQLLDYGHGQSVLSKSQYQVLLSFQTFGTTRALGVSGRAFPFPATVEDISPTVLDFLGIGGDPLSTTGQSLLPALSGVKTRVDDGPERIRFTETDLSVLPAPGGGVDEAATARQNAMFFEIDPRTARLHIKSLFAPLALAYKERAAFTHDRLLAAIPAGPYAHQYLYFDFPNRHGQLLLERPGSDMSEAQRLWDALQVHYRGELKTAVAVTPDDWPRIDAEWENFLRDRHGNGSSAGAKAAAP
jgi:hypothetical protein